MGRRRAGSTIPVLREPVAGDRDEPLYRRLYRRVREGVLSGAIAPGTRLPSARTLAHDEGISRNTVEAAYRQLRAEGFVVRRVGSGTWVDAEIPERLVRPRAALAARAARAPRDAATCDRALSKRGAQVARQPAEVPTPQGLLFTPCAPGFDDLPLSTWHRIVGRHTRRASSELLLAAPPEGLPVLREAIAGYVHLHRGVRCSADQVLILNSTQQALALTARVLLDAGDEVLLEDPGYVLARSAFAAAGAGIVPVPVDEDGMDVERGASVAPGARLACVTPSHQYPLGVTLSLARRLALIEWARDTGAWILEDDYDGELRHDCRPLAAVQGIDRTGRVLYVGTFNKILFPGVRLAYLVLPADLVAAFGRARQLTEGFTSPLLQAAMAEFVRDGHLATHLRKARDVYGERRDAFVKAAETYFPSGVHSGPTSAGMHAAVHLPPGTDDEALTARAEAEGLAAPALSRFTIRSEVRGLVVHYGNAVPADITCGIRRLAGMIRG